MPRTEKPTPEHLHTFRTGQTNAAGRTICGAKNGKGNPCASTILMTGGRCKKHGGASLVGIAHPNYTNGRTSKVLPLRMQANYEAARDDPDLIDLKNDVALIDARLIDVLSRVDTGEAGKLWQDARAAFQDFKASQQDMERAKAALAVLDGLLTRGAADWESWAEIGRLVEQRRRLVDTQYKRMVATDSMITAERAMIMFGSMAAIVRQHVQDPAILQRIAADFDRLYSVGSHPAAISGAGQPIG